MGKFGTPTEYRENPGPVYFLDDVTETRGIVFQPDVYAMAQLLTQFVADSYRVLHPCVVDVGCGWGDKLQLMHAARPDWHYVGVDYGDNLARCREAHPWGTFIEIDLEHIGDRQINMLDPDIVICSDVIEHVVDPTSLLAALRWSGARAIVVSTPERDVQNGDDHAGPPPNLCHVREWNGVEFRQLLTDAGLTVRWFGLTRGSDVGEAMATQIVVAS